MRVRVLCGVAVAISLLAGCGGGGGGGGPPPGMAVKVVAVEAKVQPVEEKLSLVASVLANESVTVQSKIDGTVATIGFEEGQAVEEGQVLIRLDEDKLKAEVAEAEANFKLAESNRARSEAMLENRTISLQEFDQAVSSFDARRAALDLVKQRWKDTKIVAPFSGIAGSRRVSPGQVVMPGMALTTVVDITPVKVELKAPERYLGQLQAGQTIAFRVPAYPGEEFRGEVYFIDPEIDPATRTVLVKARQANEDGRLRPGMFGSLDLTLRVRENAVVIPEKALVLDGDTVTVFIVDGERKAQPVPVKTGLRLAGMVEITEGLKGGETVITEGLQKIQPGALVDTGTAPASAASAP